MDDNVLKLFLTVLGSIAVLTLGELIKKFAIAPIQEQKRVIGAVAASLMFYANVYSAPAGIDGATIDETSKALRKHASELTSTTLMIPFYFAWECLRFCPSMKNIRQAIKDLTFLSNNVHSPMGMENFRIGARQRIEKALGIDWLSA